MLPVTLHLYKPLSTFARANAQQSEHSAEKKISDKKTQQNATNVA
jgi:hypothetical protein